MKQKVKQTRIDELNRDAAALFMAFNDIPKDGGVLAQKILISRNIVARSHRMYLGSSRLTPVPVTQPCFSPRIKA